MRGQQTMAIKRAQVAAARPLNFAPASFKIHTHGYWCMDIARLMAAIGRLFARPQKGA